MFKHWGQSFLIELILELVMGYIIELVVRSGYGPWSIIELVVRSVI